MSSKSNYTFLFFSLWFTYFIGGGALTYYIAKTKNYVIYSKFEKKNLYLHLESSARDLMIILPLTTSILEYSNLFQLVLTEEKEVLEFYYNWKSYVKILFLYNVSYIYRMIIHILLHSRYFYRKIHKMHHFRYDKLTPFGAYMDLPLEFFILEIFGTYLFLGIFDPLPMQIIFIFWNWTALEALLNHSNNRILNDIIDTEYHIIHHKIPNKNLAEITVLDKICGTYLAKLEK